MQEMGNFLYEEKEPVSFNSIETADPYTLTGSYGEWDSAGMSFAFISMTLGGGEVPDDGYVLTWAQIEDPETPGNIEGFYCSVKYSQTETYGDEISIETFEGTSVDFS